MAEIEFDSPAVQQKLEQVEAPASAFSQALGRITPAPPRLSGAIPQPYKPVISKREVKLHIFHLAQDVAMPGCPLCSNSSAPPAIVGKHVHNFMPATSEEGIPAWYIHERRHWPGHKTTVGMTLANGRKITIQSYPQEWAMSVRAVALKLYPTMRGHNDVRQYQIPEHLLKYVPLFEMEIKERVEKYLKASRFRK